MSRITATKREVDYVGRKLRRLIGPDADLDVTRAILQLKDLSVNEVDRVVKASVKGGADPKSADRLAVFALACKFLLIQRTFDEANRYEKIIKSGKKTGRMTLAEKIKGRNADMARQYRERAAEIGCLQARRELSEKWEISVRQVTKALRGEGIDIKKKKTG